MDELLKLIAAVATHPTTLTDAEAFGSAVQTVGQDIAKGEGGPGKVKLVLQALQAGEAALTKLLADLEDPQGAPAA